jgi:hypothetical protein
MATLRGETRFKAMGPGDVGQEMNCKARSVLNEADLLQLALQKKDRLKALKHAEDALRLLKGGTDGTT